MDRPCPHSPPQNQLRRVPIEAARLAPITERTRIAMLYDLTATDPSFQDGRAPDDIQEIVVWANSEVAGRTQWRLISARCRFGKTLFEIEEHSPSGPRRLIGRLGKREHAEHLYQALWRLRAAGFAPPGRYIVPD